MNEILTGVLHDLSRSDPPSPQGVALSLNDASNRRQFPFVARIESVDLPILEIEARVLIDAGARADDAVIGRLESARAGLEAARALRGQLDGQQQLLEEIRRLLEFIRQPT